MRGSRVVSQRKINKTIIQEQREVIDFMIASRDFVNLLMNVLVPEENRMYLISNPVASLGEYHKPNNVLQISLNAKGEEIANGLNSIAYQGVLADYMNKVSA